MHNHSVASLTLHPHMTQRTHTHTHTGNKTEDDMLEKSCRTREKEMEGREVEGEEGLSLLYIPVSHVDLLFTSRFYCVH